MNRKIYRTKAAEKHLLELSDDCNKAMLLVSDNVRFNEGDDVRGNICFAIARLEDLRDEINECEDHDD